MAVTTTLRIAGSFSLLLGYFVLLYVDTMLGCSLRLLGGIMMIPFAIHIKTWDVVSLQTFFAVMDATKIVQLL
tara:strand:- start:142 stop:360 length:219 start_codon:yes stop_codon:yes gene_type:complete